MLHLIALKGKHKCARARTHTHSVGLLWTSDQPDADISTYQHTALTTDRHPCLRWDSNPQSQKAGDRRSMHLTAQPPESAVLKIDMSVLRNALINMKMGYIESSLTYNGLWKVASAKVQTAVIVFCYNRKFVCADIWMWNATGWNL
jgi:hypothetical protein